MQYNQCESRDRQVGNQRFYCPDAFAKDNTIPTIVALEKYFQVKLDSKFEKRSKLLEHDGTAHRSGLL